MNLRSETIGGRVGGRLTNTGEQLRHEPQHGDREVAESGTDHAITNDE
jgi:hypothetical protein